MIPGIPVACWARRFAAWDTVCLHWGHGLSALDTHPDSQTFASFNQKELWPPPLSLGTFSSRRRGDFYCLSAELAVGPAILSQRNSRDVMSRQWLRVNTDANGFLQFRRAVLSPCGLNSHWDYQQEMESAPTFLHRKKGWKKGKQVIWENKNRVVALLCIKSVSEWTMHPQIWWSLFLLAPAEHTPSFNQINSIW